MGGSWNHNLQYHPLVLGAVPRSCGRALDVGCGEGALARQLGLRCGEVVGIDLDRDVLGRSSGNVSFVPGDVMSYPFVPASFDFIAAVATLHHLPLRSALERLDSLLRPGGVLVIVGLYRACTWREAAWNALALMSSYAVRVFRGYSEVRACTTWPEQTYAEIAEAAEEVLPEAEMRRQLFFRYSLIWRKADR